MEVHRVLRFVTELTLLELVAVATVTTVDDPFTVIGVTCTHVDAEVTVFRIDAVIDVIGILVVFAEEVDAGNLALKCMKLIKD